MMPNRRTVIKAHQRSYDDPIVIETGEIVKICGTINICDRGVWLQMVNRIGFHRHSEGVVANIGQFTKGF
jgi:hypothetical protein